MPRRRHDRRTLERAITLWWPTTRSTAREPAIREDLAPSPHKSGSTQGFYLSPRPDGFVLHMNASAAHLVDMRAHVLKTVTSAGGTEELADAARLVASELVGNAVRLCGPHAPVVVLLAHTEQDVVVQVHDPEPAALPCRSTEPPDNPRANTGRGLWILDALAPGWTVTPTPLGKQITCTLPRH
ncbi:ATP-binding protein [Kitasatospora griseola]|uniref:ATP-binding protein n=1 Tax=Kitasatospora griseola TaxID=2064 RepID=UPI000A563D99|nr:ATP-binding protein [Kitasatospora griseola]GGQ53274.1 ATP-binding protein [Kitasatospora griseola]